MPWPCDLKHRPIIITFALKHFLFGISVFLIYLCICGERALRRIMHSSLDTHELTKQQVLKLKSFDQNKTCKEIFVIK